MSIQGEPEDVYSFIDSLDTDKLVVESESEMKKQMDDLLDAIMRPQIPPPKPKPPKSKYKAMSSQDKIMLREIYDAYDRVLRKLVLDKKVPGAALSRLHELGRILDGTGT